LIILGIGCDIVSINSIRRSLRCLGNDYLCHILSEDERVLASAAPDVGQYVACTFAAKEACVKALGTGFARGIEWHDIKVMLHGTKNLMTVSGAAETVIKSSLPADHQSDFHLTVATGGDLAQAFVISTAVPLVQGVSSSSKC